MRALSFLSLVLLCALCSNGYAQPGRTTTSKASKPMFPAGLRVGMTVDEVNRAMAQPPLSAAVAFDEAADGQRVVSYKVTRIYGVASKDWDCIFNASGKLIMVSAPMAAEGIEENAPSFRILGDSLKALLGEPTGSTEMVEQTLDAAEKSLDSAMAAEGKSLHNLDYDEEMVEAETLKDRDSEDPGPFISWEMALSKSDNVLSYLYLDPETQILSMGMSLEKKKPEPRTKRHRK